MGKSLFSGFRRCAFLLSVFLGVMVLCGCGKARIDARNAETYRKSLQEMRRTLSGRQQEALDQAVEKIFRHERRWAAEYGSADGDAGIMLLLDNLTADEIIAKAEKIKEKGPTK